MSQECPEFQYVEQIKWKYQGNTYGLIDFQMKCSGKILWESPAVGNHDGAWDPVMRCKVVKKYIKKMYERELIAG